MSNKATQFKKGQSGNPNGRPPKDISLTDLMRNFLAGVPEGQKKARKEFLVTKVYEMAMKGDQAALKLVWNYVEGMPKQDFNHSAEILVQLVNYAKRKKDNPAV